MNYPLRHRPMVIFHTVLVLCAIAANIYFQVFCIPTTWATVLLIVCFATSISLPYLQRFHHFQPVFGFLGGITFSVFLYCIIFLEQMNGWGLLLLLFFGAGLIVYISHFTCYGNARFGQPI